MTAPEGMAGVAAGFGEPLRHLGGTVLPRRLKALPHQLPPRCLGGRQHAPSGRSPGGLKGGGHGVGGGHLGDAEAPIGGGVDGAAVRINAVKEVAGSSGVIGKGADEAWQEAPLRMAATFLRADHAGLRVQIHYSRLNEAKI